MLSFKSKNISEMQRPRARKKVGILVESSYEDLELWYPMFRLRESLYNTFTIGPEKGKVYNSKHGYPCKADYGIDEISAKDLDGLIIPGGWSPDYLRKDDRFVQLVKEAVLSGKVVGAIGYGPWLLCSARCIKGRRLTCFVTIRDDVENAGGIYEDSDAVVDKNLVTSSAPSDVAQFAVSMIGVLTSRS